jgi:RNA-dependent RNA polymerase
MELFFSNLDYRATLMDVEHLFATVLHSPGYLPSSTLPWNFHVYLFPPQKNRPGQTNGGRGTVTVPDEKLGHQLLGDFGGISRISLSVGGRKLRLALSRGKPKAPILEKIRLEPYTPPEVRQRLTGIKKTFQKNTAGIRTLQLGWETRSGVFSVEWEKHFPPDCHLSFNDTRREVRIRLTDLQDVRSIAIHWSQISWSAVGYANDEHPSIFLSLYSPPVFDIGDSAKRQRLLALYPDDPDLIRVLPYATLCIRLLCPTMGDLETFKHLCKVARLSSPKDYAYHAEHLERFSETRLEQFHRWTKELHWPVAFQLEALLRGRLADTKEVLSIRRIVDDMVARKGISYTATFLRSVTNTVAVEVLDDHHDEGGFEASVERYASDFSPSSSPHPWDPKDGVFDCLHISISPTSMKLGGPFPERSNRVMRTYAENHDSFIRVSFVEENNLRYQQDREIDGPGFIGRWVSPILRDGVNIAGRQFNFLAYSQSALKSHTVWFVKDFTDSSGELITATKIIAGLGNFDGLEYDPRLMYCPARYAARISQAFTTTESSISVPAEEMFIKEDIELGSHCFTDGVGNISPQLSRKIWKALQKRGSRSTRKAWTYPRAFQIRLVGAKGMLSVDHTLSGDVVILRKSMIKFEAPHSTDVEIAQAFVRPSKYYLNRPLIMILEGLGIPCNVFMKLQDAAVQEVEAAVTSLEKAAKTLDKFGLAVSYRVSSTLLHLSKLGLDPCDMDDFYDQMLLCSIYHILRDLKHHARIPVDDGYTLVGVADIHGYLQEGEVFACVAVPETNSLRYLTGPVLVSRSPTIHPGDVQVVHAIGRPPVGSPFQKEPLMNTIVFSVNGNVPFRAFANLLFTLLAGTRPLPSCLGGGDLDGDTYNVTPFIDLHPPQNYPPAAYEPAQRKTLTRRSTMDDVADFVADYINSDVSIVNTLHNFLTLSY